LDQHRSNSHVAIWSEVIDIVQSMAREVPQVRSSDNNPLTSTEAWNKCLLTVLTRLQLAADRSPKNVVAIKMLPWTCGECGKDSIRKISVYSQENRSFLAVCEDCGTEWIS
jgi:hypothetical protein